MVNQEERGGNVFIDPVSSRDTPTPMHAHTEH
jgi:hypothetical protein